MSHASLSQLSDAALIESAQFAVRRERSCTAEVVAHIAEVGARKLHLRAGYSSLRDWCIAKLGLSEDAAYKRIQAARASRRVPRVLPMLERGELSLSALVTLAPVLAPGNAAALLERAAGRTKLEVQQLVAEQFPQPDLPTVVTTSDTTEPLVPSMKTGCQRSIPTRPCATQPPLTIRLFGVGPPPHVSFREAGPTRNNGLVAQIACRGALLHVQRRSW